MKLLVYHNPNAGHGDVPKDRLADELQRAGHHVTWVEKGEGKLSDALAAPLDGVVVVGGDGSVGAVGRGLVGRDLPIAIVPAGTANNIARSVGARPDNLIGLLKRGRTTPFDVGWVEGLGEPRRFLEGVGLGAFADTAALLKTRDDDDVEGREDELERDLHVLSERVRSLEPSRYDLELDGREISGDFLLVEVTNGGVIGPNLRLADDAVPTDARLDVTLVDVAEREELLAFVSARARGQSLPSPFAVRQAQRVRLRVSTARSLHIDGDTRDLDGVVDLRIRIEPAALRFYADLSGADGPAGRPGSEP